MKNIFKLTLILMFTFFTYTTISAQLDTLAYIKQFEINKANYIGQPFSKLLNDMTKIQPKTVWPETDGRRKVINIGSIFKFTHKELSFNNAITLLIYWQEPQSSSEVMYYGRKNNFYFTDEEKLFYGNKIIKNILVYR